MPGGAIEIIPDTLRNEVCNIAPRVDWESVKSLSEQFQIESSHDAQSPSKVKESLTKIVNLSVDLKKELLMLSEEARNELFDQIGPYQDVKFFESVIGALSSLSGHAMRGHNNVETNRGNPGSLKQSFIRSIAAKLKDAGYDATAKPNDKLCQIMQRLLAHYDACPADISKMVREALGK